MESTRHHSASASSSSSSEDGSANSAVDTFIQNYGSSNNAPQTSSTARLCKPVVISQRRPGNKERGFIKAYAPDLQAFGIDQETFLAFIDAVNKSAKASKWLHAIQVAAFGTGFIPNHIAFGVSAAVQIVAGIVAKTETRWKTNAFMDQMNADFFQPRGLYCLIMSYNPVNMPGQVNSDPVEAVATHKPSPSAPAKGFVSKAKQNLRSPSAGTSQGEDNLPDSVADLVYPEPATVSESADTKAKKKAFTRLDHYFDRRAQARYASESKGDVLSSNQHGSFSNRYLDPNHPATNGGLLGLLSGGKLTPDLKKQREQMGAAMRDQQQAVLQLQSDQMNNLEATFKGMGLSPEQQQAYIQQLQSANDVQMQQFEEQSKMLENGQRRINRNILYLMIINLPTAEEMEAASKKELAGHGIWANDVRITNLDV